MSKSLPTATVAVITPAYNHAAFLPECLNSLLDQHYIDWVCVVMDDGSTDTTPEIVHRFCKQDHRIQYAWQPNQGPGAARNNAVSLCESEFILPLDADDRLAPAYLEKVVGNMLANPKAKIVYTACAHFDAQHSAIHLSPYRYASLLAGNIIPVTALFRRIDFFASGGYDPDMRDGWEDWDYWLKLLRPMDEISFLDEVLFYYRRKSSSRNADITADQAYRLRRYVYEKHAEIYNQYFEDPLNLAHRIKLLETENRSLRNRDVLYRTEQRLRKFFRMK